MIHFITVPTNMPVCFDCSVIDCSCLTKEQKGLALSEHPMMIWRDSCDYFQMWKAGFSFLGIDNAKQSSDCDIARVFSVT